MSTKILIIEDDSAISRFVSLELMHEGYDADICADGRDGLDKALSKNYDLIILDVMLPSLSGIEVLRRLRNAKSTPVIMLTARDQVVDKVTGLDVGANDYMTKPFAIEELLARIRVCLKTKTSEQQKSFVHGKLNIDTISRIVKYGDETVDLTKKEFDLLVYLLENRNNVVTRERILDSVWGYDFFGSANIVDVYIRYLRSKLDDRFKVEIIQTVRGSGYVIRNA